MTMFRGIAVGVHTSISPEDLAKVALDSKADVIVVDGEFQLKKVRLR
jgi:type IV secretory pathway ATPase VirB11/archaellum biosynthesis ATPase